MSASVEGLMPLILAMPRFSFFPLLCVSLIVACSSAWFNLGVLGGSLLSRNA